MAKTETAQTRWLGLWEHKGGVFSGEVFSKKAIPPYSRIIMVPNKAYKPNTHRPKWVYSFAVGEKDYAVDIDEKELTCEMLCKSMVVFGGLDSFYICSNCDTVFHDMEQVEGFRYCPLCGRRIEW